MIDWSLAGRGAHGEQDGLRYPEFHRSQITGIHSRQWSVSTSSRFAGLCSIEFALAARPLWITSCELAQGLSAIFALFAKPLSGRSNGAISSSALPCVSSSRRNGAGVVARGVSRPATRSCFVADAVGWWQNRLKVQLKLAISRLRMVQQKDTALAKQQRRAMAQLLETGKVESAKIRVENIIRSDITSELHEMLELYCELLLARSQLLDPPSPLLPATGASSAAPTVDPALDEAVRSLVHAAPRTDVKELHNVRALLVEKFGKDVAIAAMDGQGVAPRVLDKLQARTPSPKLVDAYLAEIARFYGVPYASADGDDGDDDDDDGSDEVPEPAEKKTRSKGETQGSGGDTDGDDDDHGHDSESGGGGGGIVKSIENPDDRDHAKVLLTEFPLRGTAADDKDDASPFAKARPHRAARDDEDRDGVSALSRATPPRRITPSSPLRITPPAPRSDNIAPRVKLPGSNASTKTTRPSTGRSRGSDAGGAEAKASGKARTGPGEDGDVGKKSGKAGAPEDKKSDGPGGRIPDVDELARRFAQLKR